MPRPEMKTLELVQTSRDYLDYVERHLNNVARAFEVVEQSCVGMKIIWDDYCYHCLLGEVKHHDQSKLGPNEFTQYRDYFYPSGEKPAPPSEAFEHHNENNNHHWQNWTISDRQDPDYQPICCAHMVIDWLAMSFEFGDTPRQFYESNRERIQIPEWAVTMIYEMFENIEKHLSAHPTNNQNGD